MPRTQEVPEEEPGVTPNIAAIAKLIAPDGPVHRAEEAGQTSRSNLGNLYKKAQDDYHGHRGAVKQVRVLLSMSATARADFMRTFEPLAEHFNLFPSQNDGDMIDQVERETAGTGDGAAKPGPLDAARKHLESGGGNVGGVVQDPPAKIPSDDSDLAGGPEAGKGPKAEPEVAASAAKAASAPKKAAAKKPAAGGKPVLGIVAGTDTKQ